MINSIILAKERTKMANQRTYLAYMRTGFTIAGISGHFRHFYVALFGLFMIIFSTIQYNYVLYKINKNQLNSKINFFDLLPVVYFILSILVLYIQYYLK
jgi:uncharacterized membrane protein YidH (DUF202 family)